MQFISWLELAALATTPSRPEEKALITLHPIVMNGQLRFIGVTIEGRWLRGHDARLTVFHDQRSASRFLRMLKQNSFRAGDLFDGSDFENMQCFRFNGRQLSTCNKTHEESSIQRTNGHPAVMAS